MDRTFRTGIDKALIEMDISGLSLGAVTGGHNGARILISVFTVRKLLASVGTCSAAWG